MVNFIKNVKLTDSLRSGIAVSTLWLKEVDGVVRGALPGRCVFCLAACQFAEPWCEACFERLPWNLPACPGCAEPQMGQLKPRRCGHCLAQAPAFALARVPLRYEDEIAALVQRFKFHASPRAGAVLVELLAAGLRRQAQHWPEALVPVPLHPRRARERGFDQANWLTRRLATRLNCTWETARRERDTRSQRGLTRRERRANLRHAFRVETPLPPHVALVDDVMTTGSTQDALAVACRRAGAETVEAWAVARTPPGKHW